MKVPFFANHLQYTNLKKEWDSRVEKVWKSGQYFNGKEVHKLEERLALIGKRKYAVAMGSCSDALMIAAKYFSASRWAVSPFTFIASAAGSIRAGSKIHLTSLNSKSFCPQVKEYSHSLSTQSDIEGIIHVDLYGSCQHTSEVEEYCKINKLTLIEDAAQSFGGHYNSRPSGNFGDASCLSFDPTKIISGTSAAGALLTDNHDLYEFAQSIRLHGKSPQGGFSHIGLKSLMSCAEATIIDLKLNYLHEWIAKRNSIADQYSHFLNHELIKLPQHHEGHTSSFHKYVIKVPSTLRSSLRKHLLDNGIETRVHYSRDLSHEPALQNSEVTKDSPIKLHHYCDEVLSLPIYPELKEDQIQHVTQKIQEFLNG